VQGRQAKTGGVQGRHGGDGVVVVAQVRGQAVASLAVVASECREHKARDRGGFSVMGAAEEVQEVVVACAHPSTARQGAGCLAGGTAADGDGGTAGTTGAGRKRGGVAARAVDGAEEAEGPDGNRAAMFGRRVLAGAGAEVEQTGGQSKDRVERRGRRSRVGEKEGIEGAKGPGEVCSTYFYIHSTSFYFYILRGLARPSTVVVLACCAPCVWVWGFCVRLRTHKLFGLFVRSHSACFWLAGLFFRLSM
jgi:hypothetical protein